MPKKTYKEYKLHIHEKIRGEEITPLTLPMARLADYLADFATLLGYQEHVHFRAVEDGSAMPIALVEIEQDTNVRRRVQETAAGFGPKDAAQAYARINTRLREHEGYGEVIETIGERQSNLIEFPGSRKQTSPMFGPIKESAFVQGELKRVGGEEPTIPVWLEDADGKRYYCSADKTIATQLGTYIFKQVRLYGIATWLRDETASWKLDNFLIQSFVAPLGNEQPDALMAELRSVPGSDWNKFEDPLAELRAIRHGKDKIQ